MNGKLRQASDAAWPYTEGFRETTVFLLFIEEGRRSTPKNGGDVLVGNPATRCQYECRIVFVARSTAGVRREVPFGIA